jgi:uncharacterized OB-fold protein
VDWITLSGKGTVYSFTIVRHPVVPALRDSVPYVIAVVSLPDAGGQRLITNILDTDPDTLHIGQEVEVVFDDDGSDATIPRFTPSVASEPT